MCFAPADKPRVALAILVEDVHDVEGFVEDYLGPAAEPELLDLRVKLGSDALLHRLHRRRADELVGELALAGLEVGLQWQQQDIRNLDDSIGTVDMALALDVMSEMDALRDLEAVFKGVHRVLGPNKLFIFDMYTIEGLTQAGLSSDSIAHNDRANLTVFSHTEYDYERQMQTLQYTIFRREGVTWTRSEATRILRASGNAAAKACMNKVYSFFVRRAWTCARR